MVAGSAPGRFAPTLMVGNSTCGSGATGSNGKATSPTNRIPPMIREVAIGRRTNGSEMLISARPPGEALQPKSASKALVVFQVCLSVLLLIVKAVQID